MLGFLVLFVFIAVWGCGEVVAKGPEGGGSETCAAAGQRLLECGFEQDSSWVAGCSSDPTYAACLSEHMDSCDGLSLCGLERFSRAQCGGLKIGAGANGCEATTGCEG